MPANLSYPGVYIEEIKSGVRSIAGVPTSITAFVGSASRGPVNKAVSISSFTEYTQIFGGLHKTYRMGYAVRDFFINGGGEAVIVRLFHGDAAALSSATVNLAVGAIALNAAYPGKWGNKLRITIDQNVSAEVATAMGIAKADLFNLRVTDSAPGGLSEQYRNVTLISAASRRLDKELANSSSLVRWAGVDLDAASGPIALPALGADGTISDALTEAEKALKAAMDTNPPVQATIDAAKAAVAAASAAADALGADSAALDANDYMAAGKKGIRALEDADLFNMLCLPPDSADIPGNVLDFAAGYCELRRSMLIVDPPSSWNTVDKARDGVDGLMARSKNAALYFPRLRQQDPLSNNQLDAFAPCGAVAGIYARTDNQRGVWKAPAGTAATISGAIELSVPMTDNENGRLNPIGINCLRSFPAIGRVVWGSRTLRGADLLSDEWKYVPVRRTALYIEESLFRGTQWVVFEPNDENLWAQIRMNIGSFMHTLFTQGAFQGRTPQEAYLVKCDKETTTQADIDRGVVNIVVGFAPLKPAEFVIITIQQLAGQITV